jgi:hypothetical protein
MTKLVFATTATMLLLAPAIAQDTQPSCKGCPATYIGNEEIDAYLKRAVANKIVDQQVRSVNVGKSNVAVGLSFIGLG